MFALGASPRGPVFDNYLFICLAPNQTELSHRIENITDMHSACIFPTHVHRTLIVYIISSSHANNTSKEALVSSFHKSLV